MQCPIMTMTNIWTRVSQPQHYCYLELDFSWLWGCAVYYRVFRDPGLYPWMSVEPPLFSHPILPLWQQKGFQVLPNVPWWRTKSLLVENHCSVQRLWLLSTCSLPLHILLVLGKQDCHVKLDRSFTAWKHPVKDVGKTWNPVLALLVKPKALEWGSVLKKGHFRIPMEVTCRLASISKLKNDNQRIS